MRCYHHQLQPKKEEEDDSEQRPRALMGPIGDDFFEQPACFVDPNAHSANAHVVSRSALFHCLSLSHAQHELHFASYFFTCAPQSNN